MKLCIWKRLLLENRRSRGLVTVEEHRYIMLLSSNIALKLV
jgi:hypothetical protein